MKHRIRGSAPGKLMLFGEHAVVYGYPCIVTAVDQRLSVCIEVNNVGELIVNAPDVGLLNYRKKLTHIGKGYTKESAFVEKATENFIKKFNIRSGISITSSSEFRSTFGFGSSSAITVAVLFALSKLFNKKLSKSELFQLSYKTVLEVQKKGSGFDVASAIYGGTIYYKRFGRIIKSIQGVSDLIVGYTGVKADTVSLISNVQALHQKNPEIVNSIYKTITTVVDSAVLALKRKDLKTIGELMNINQGLLESLGVSTKTLSQMNYAANINGFGAKLSGAGGGDCMIAIASSKNKKLGLSDI